MNARYGSKLKPDDGCQADVDVEALWRKVMSSGEGGPTVSNSFKGEKHWVHINSAGKASLIAINRHDLVHSLKLRYRDLVIVDPSLPIPVPSSILVRARAIAVNLDVGGVMRIIICQNQVFVLSVPKAADPGITALPSLQHPLVRRLARTLRPTATSRLELSATPSDYLLSSVSAYVDVENMPYELRALEVVLNAALGILADEISSLEIYAYPKVDELLSRISRSLLEDVRNIKNRIDRLQAKVHRIHTELSELLADDDDMNDMYLERRAERQGLPPLRQADSEKESESGDESPQRRTRESESGRRRIRTKNVVASDFGAGPTRRRRHRRGRAGRHGRSTNNYARPSKPILRRVSVPRQVQHHASCPNFDNSGEARQLKMTDEEDSETKTLSEGGSDVSDLFELEEERMMNREWSDDGRDDDVVRPHDIEEVEDMLETFFERADLLLRRLNILDERVDDTEDLLELDLDQRRNELVALNLLVASIAMSFGFSAAIAGFFGMNLANAKLIDNNWVLALVLSTTVGASAILLLLVFWWVHRRKLVFIPSTF